MEDWQIFLLIIGFILVLFLILKPKKKPKEWWLIEKTIGVNNPQKVLVWRHKITRQEVPYRK